MRFEKIQNSQDGIEGAFATSEGAVYLTQSHGTVTVQDTDTDCTEFTRVECEELWPALKAFAETGDIRNAEYGPRVPPLVVRPTADGNGYGANFLSEGEKPCHAGISQEEGCELVELRTAEFPYLSINLARDTAERLALVLLRFAKTGRIEEQPKDVGTPIGATGTWEWACNKMSEGKVVEKGDLGGLRLDSSGLIIRDDGEVANITKCDFTFTKWRVREE